jgi:pyruvate ferredoxin oxidoreductase alpha subunit
MSERDVIHGSLAAALGAKLCKVDVIAAYPITPQTHIVEDLAKMVADGELDAKYIKVESEHSAMAACIGASATGARTFTATSSQGLALMHEVLFIASGMRLPIVMANANRALSAPINIWNDQQDAMAERDCGWIQLYCETNQEVLDTVIQAFRIAEDKDVMTPVMVNLDGFVLTHTNEPVEIPDEGQVKKYLPEFVPQVTLDPASPITMGAFADPSSYMEFRHEQERAIEGSLDVIKKADEEFGKVFGRSYGGHIEKYNMENADTVLVTLGSVAGTIKETIDSMEGVGLLRIRTYRPLPKQEILDALKGAKVVGVIEKDVSIGLGEGALYSEIKGLLYASDLNPKTLGFIVGLGGRDVTFENIKEAVSLAQKAETEEVKEVTWVGLK